MAPLADDTLARARLRHWRGRMFASMFFGYAILYFGRKNISSVLPLIGQDQGLSNVELGLIGTALYASYGFGKFLNGVLADQSNIRTFMATGLVVSGLLNIVFGSVSGLFLLALVWAFNGWFQSMGFPPIARGMTLWYPPTGRATRWAFWTCSHQAGTAAIMALTGVLVATGTWRSCFVIPGALCVFAGFVLLWSMGDTPESKGLPSARVYAQDCPGSEPDFFPTFVRCVLKNRNVWAIGLVDLCVYVIRFGTLDWTTKFLVEEKAYDVSAAAFRAALMPLAGIVGVLASGYVADVVFKARYRVLSVVSLALLAVCLYGFVSTGADHPVLDLVFLLGIGFFVEGPQSILGGVGAVDAGGSARVASSAAGLVGILAYVGASVSGVGTGYFLDAFGWTGAFGFWGAMSVLGIAVSMGMWREAQASQHEAPAVAGTSGQ